MLLKHTSLLIVALVLALLSGCRSSGVTHKDTAATEAAQSAAAPTGTPVDPATAGTLAGTVSFKGKPPARLPIDMSQDPACALTGGDNPAEQFVISNGKLANVYVSIKTGPAAAMNAAPPPATTQAVLDQKGCRYTPHVVAIVRGGTVEFRNSDPTMHNIHTMPAIAGNGAIDISQAPHGAPQLRRFPTPEAMLPVRCNNHPWMNAFINVAPTPFFAVTDTAGHFTITGLPAGHYTLTAVHERLGAQDLPVDVKPQETTEANLSFTAK